MRSVALIPLALVAYLVPKARAAGETYDDRVMIDRALRAAQKLQPLIPLRNQTRTRPNAFANKTLTAGPSELRAVLRAVAAASRWRGAPEEILRHRKTMKDEINRFLAELGAYRTVFTSVATLRRKLDAIKKVKPPGG